MAEAVFEDNDLHEFEAEVLPEPTQLDDLRLNTALWYEYAKDIAPRVLGGALKLGALALATGLAVYPAAKVEAARNAEVHTTFLAAPTDLRLTGNGMSSLETGFSGTLYAPVNKDGIGITGRINDLPFAGKGGVSAILSPAFRDIVTGYVSNPKKVANNYTALLKEDAHEKFWNYEAMSVAALDTIAILGFLAVPKQARRRLKERPLMTAVMAAGSAGLLVAIGNGTANSIQEDWAHESPAPQHQTYAITAFQGTFLEGTVASNQELQMAINQAAPGYQKNIDRQGEASKRFMDKATDSFEAQIANLTAPEPGEIATMPLSDTHGIQTMLHLDRYVLNRYQELFGSDVVKTVLVTGDLTNLGTPGEGNAVRGVANIGDGDTPVTGIAGDHDSPENITQMKQDGIIVPNLTAKSVGGIKVLGANDTAQKTFGIRTSYIDDIDEVALGKELRSAADKDTADVVLTHEGYAVMSFLDLPIKTHSEMKSFLEDNGPNDTYLRNYREDNIPNIPAKAIYFGHWHEAVTPRVIWNVSPTDGRVTWTYVRELNTAGGAIGNPTINHFTIPTYPPLQDAEIEIDFMNQDTKLVTGYQRITFHPNGSVEIHPRVNIGLPGGQPGWLSQGGQTISMSPPQKQKNTAEQSSYKKLPGRSAE